MTSDAQQFSDRLHRLRSVHLDEIESLIDAAHDELNPGPSLTEMADYHYATGGKRVRALIPLLVAETLGKPPSLVVPFAAACEVLHNATLVHDDLQDGDEMRRGKPTVWVRYGAPSAINLGDAMLYHTIALAMKTDVPSDRIVALVDSILRSAIHVIDGQEREFALMREEDPTIKDYFRMVRGKTSGLFALPFCGTVAILGLGADLSDGLSAAAQHLGVLFQLQDDLLDIYGEKGRGRRGSDIAEGKISALTAYCLQHAKPEERTWLRELLQKERAQVTDAEIETAITLFETSGARDLVLRDLRLHRDQMGAVPALAAHPQLLGLLDAIAGWFLDPIQDILDGDG